MLAERGHLSLQVGAEIKSITFRGPSFADIGLGLQNTKARLKHLYADEAALSFELGSDGVAIATITLPAFVSHEEREAQLSNAHAHHGG